MQVKDLPRTLMERKYFSNVRECDEEEVTEESHTKFWYFFSVLVPTIAGKKVWTKEMMCSKPIQESLCVTVTDEAFTVLCIENYWAKWMSNGDSIWRGTRQGNK
jgi:hypothetical protein